jgi:hypothetical protein
MKNSSESAASALLAEQELGESREKGSSLLNFEIHREGSRTHFGVNGRRMRDEYGHEIRAAAGC